jgi:hypothetical protein
LADHLGPIPLKLNKSNPLTVSKEECAEMAHSFLVPGINPLYYGYLLAPFNDSFGSKVYTQKVIGMDYFQF